MLVRKSQIQHLIDKTVEKAEKSKDDYWEHQMKTQIEKNDWAFFLEIQDKESELKGLTKRLNNMEAKVKEAERKYFSGRALIKKAKYVLKAISEEYNEILDQHQKQGQRFKALETEIDESERKLITEDEA